MLARSALPVLARSFCSRHKGGSFCLAGVRLELLSTAVLGFGTLSSGPLMLSVPEDLDVYSIGSQRAVALEIGNRRDLASTIGKYNIYHWGCQD